MALRVKVSFDIKFTLIRYLSYFVDIDECLENTDQCTQGCNDSDGSYECYCHLGYRLASDMYACNGESVHVWLHSLSIPSNVYITLLIAYSTNN